MFIASVAAEADRGVSLSKGIDAFALQTLSLKLRRRLSLWSEDLAFSGQSVKTNRAESPGERGWSVIDPGRRAESD